MPNGVACGGSGMKLSLEHLLAVLREPDRMTQLSHVEWAQLLTAARMTKLLGRLGSLAEQLDLYPDIPCQAAHHLRDANRQALHQQLTLRWEVDRVEEALRGIDTPIVLLKGAAYVMGRLAAAAGRECSDIDVLVSFRALDAVEGALLKHGWEYAELGEGDDRYFRLWLHELPPLVHKSRQTELDVHHALLPRTDGKFIDSRLLFERIKPLPAGTSCLLSPADMVLHSAVHMFRNGDWAAALRDLSDQDSLLREFGQNDAFWDELLASAVRLRLETACYFCIRYVRKYFCTPIPEVCRSEVSRWRPAFPPLGMQDFLVERALCAQHDDRLDSWRELSLSYLSHIPLPRLTTWLTPLFWSKRLKFGKAPAP